MQKRTITRQIQQMIRVLMTKLNLLREKIEFLTNLQLQINEMKMRMS